MRSFRRPAALALLVALALTGCAAPTSLDIPMGSDAPTVEVTQTPTPTFSNPVVAPSADAPGTIDCATALSPEALGEQLGFPADYAKLTAGSGVGTCIYTIGSGNAGITVNWVWTTIAPADLVKGWPADATPVAFGDAAAIQIPASDSGQPTNFQALAGNVQMTLSAFVGDQAHLEAFARTFYAALGIVVA